MREIKFRVWCSKEKELIYEPQVESTSITLGSVNEQFTCNPGEKWMQYTGLKDKNGKEIYEADILELQGGGDIVSGEVFMEYGCWCFKAPWIKEGNNYPELKYYVDMTFMDCEVIGNIYENPELLK